MLTATHTDLAGVNMKSTAARNAFSVLTVAFLILGYSAQAAAAQDATPEHVATPSTGSDETGSVDLDVLFIGAHPDDEAGNLSTFGQWNELQDMNVGVITITRGEGGGNAVGTEEGPALGLIREREERTAVGMAGIEHVYNLDKVDYYYTVSAPLTEETWGYDDTLARVVRVIRETRPEIIVTMNPSPTPGNHGHHQMAARFAVDGFYAAADTGRFTDQLTDEGLEPWRAARVLRSGAAGEGTPGPDCASTYAPVESTDDIYGVWSGTASERNSGQTWAQVERAAQKTYASQGWSAFPDADTDPALLTCDFYTLIDTRVPMPSDPTATTAILENAILEGSTGLPAGSEFYLTTDSFLVEPGVAFTVEAHLRAAPGGSLGNDQVTLALPDGWTLGNGTATPVAGVGGATPVTSSTDNESSQTFVVTPSEDAEVNTRFVIGAAFGNAETHEAVLVAPVVSGVLQPLPGVAQFREWAADVGAPQLDSLILAVDSIGLGNTSDLNVVVQNNSDQAQSGAVALELPAGFEAAMPRVSFEALAAGESTTVAFAVTNTDTALKTSNEGGEEGSYPITITTEAGGETSAQPAALNLVPVAAIPQASSQPTVDGAIGDGEYSGNSLDLSRVWEGDDPESPADASGTGQITWTGDGVYIAVSVTDDTLGTVLTPEDSKRHWRTDSVEIAIDPLGTAANTSSTFKVGEFPVTTSGAPAAYRDADAHQGAVSETAPGFQIASVVSEPYTGYVIESFIPFSALPADIDPDKAAIDIFIYDSDTQDLTGQTRLGWSTWNGVQGDPYRWGQTTFEGYQPPAGARVEPDAPIMPLDVAQSTSSPQSIAQSASDGVGLAGRRSVGDDQVPQVVQGPILTGGNVSLQIDSGTNGIAAVFLVSDEGQIVSNSTVEVVAGQAVDVTLPADGATSGIVYIGFESEDARVGALAVPLIGP